MPAINAAGYGGMNVSWQQYQYASRISAARSAAANPSQPDTPVEPVSAVRRVTPDAAVRTPVAVQEIPLPTEDALNNASDNLARMRIQQAQGTLQPEEPQRAENDENAQAAQAAQEAQPAEEAAPADEQSLAQAEVNKNVMTPAGIS